MRGIQLESQDKKLALERLASDEVREWEIVAEDCGTEVGEFVVNEGEVQGTGLNQQADVSAGVGPIVGALLASAPQQSEAAKALQLGSGPMRQRAKGAQAGQARQCQLELAAAQAKSGDLGKAHPLALGEKDEGTSTPRRKKAQWKPLLLGPAVVAGAEQKKWGPSFKQLADKGAATKVSEAALGATGASGSDDPEADGAAKLLEKLRRRGGCDELVELIECKLILLKK